MDILLNINIKQLLICDSKDIYKKQENIYIIITKQKT